MLPARWWCGSVKFPATHGITPAHSARKDVQRFGFDDKIHIYYSFFSSCFSLGCGDVPQARMPLDFVYMESLAEDASARWRGKPSASLRIWCKESIIILLFLLFNLFVLTGSCSKASGNPCNCCRSGALRCCFSTNGITPGLLLVPLPSAQSSFSIGLFFSFFNSCCTFKRSIRRIDPRRFSRLLLWAVALNGLIRASCRPSLWIFNAHRLHQALAPQLIQSR